MRSSDNQRTLRSILVALLVATLTFSPATACNFCGGYGGGYYRSGSYCGGCQPVYYESCYRDSCCGDTYHGGCCGDVVVSGCCGDCGACDECTSCAGQDMAPTQAEPQRAAPEPPAYEPRRTPSTVNRMPAEPAPSLPPQAMPSAEPSHAAPAARPEAITPPPTEMPAMEPSTPPAENHDSLFGPPSTDEAPLPVEEPATPAEADDFFSAPAIEPAAEPSSQPTDTDLFGPPAEEKPAEEAAPPAEEESDDNTDLFGNSEAILELPGGLASHSLRHWVDNTGSFACNGRLVRMLDGKVQLLKGNGRTTTVPLARLSQADFEFVNRQASAQQAEAIGKTAQASTSRSH